MTNSVCNGGITDADEGKNSATNCSTLLLPCLVRGYQQLSAAISGYQQLSAAIGGYQQLSAACGEVVYMGE